MSLKYGIIKLFALVAQYTSHSGCDGGLPGGCLSSGILLVWWDPLTELGP